MPIQKSNERFVRESLRETLALGIRFVRARYGVWALRREGSTDVEFIREQHASTVDSRVPPGRTDDFMASYLRDPRPIRGISEPDGDPFLAVPVVAGNNLLGALYFGGRQDSTAFEFPHMRLAEFLGRMCVELMQGNRTTIEFRRYVRFMRETLNEHSATCVTDPGRTVIFWSRGARVLFGYAEQEILGRSILLLVPPEELKARKNGYPPGIYQTLIGGNVARFEGRRLGKDAREVHVRSIISPVCHSIAGIIAITSFTRFEPISPR